MDTDKIIISVQIPKDFYIILKKKAEEECTTVSFLLRRMIIRDVREGDEEHE